MPLSRDHHGGLLFCWKIREALKLEIPLQRIRPYMAYYWHEHLQEHFEEEETLLFDKVDDPLCDQALADHVQMRILFERIVDTENAEMGDYKKLEMMMNAHIRFEERALFPFLEKAMTGEQLIAAGQALNAHHAKPWEDKYADEFWVKKV